MEKAVEKKRGRPRQRGSRINLIQCRLSDMELEIISDICRSTGKSISEMIRISLMRYVADYPVSKLKMNDIFDGFDRGEDKIIELDNGNITE